MKTIFFSFIGGVIGSYITLRFEIWKAWKSYVIVRAEIERNLRIINNIQDHTNSTDNYGTQQKQIVEIMNLDEDKIPFKIISLFQEKIPSWADQAWNSQIGLLAQILTEHQVTEIFEIQTDLIRLSSIHSQISELIIKYGDGSRDRCIKLHVEWEKIVKNRQKTGNPLPIVSVKKKLLLITGLHHFIKG
ncbi:hypothetical protein [Desulfobacula sp.]|uniref:hypothetical protein n=1 Tax=Desulfobacula sp. TaxID=2593537 RepID=UPI0026320637|nr:hypothetical protein [Desulfobacula sp.]